MAPAGQARPVLSICVPTRNRQQQVEATLTRELAPDRYPFPIEIVLSDNASTDETQAVARRFIAERAPLRYHRHAEDKGVYVNMVSCLRRAHGDFAVYLADDDMLVTDALIEAVAFMHATPACIASYGPIDIIDGASGVSRGRTYAIDHDLCFEPGDRLAAARFVLEHQVIPETAVFRTAALAGSLFLSRSIHWSYHLLDRLLDLGRVQFRAKPYYAWRAPDRASGIATSQMQGIEECESQLRGMHLIYYAALRAAGARVEDAERAALEAALARFGAYVRNQAVYTVAMRGQLADAIDIIKLLAGAGTLDRAGVLDELAANSAAAVYQLTCELIDQAGGIDRLFLYGFGAAAAAIANGFRVVSPDLPVVVADGAIEVPAPDSAFVLTAHDGLRADAIALGVPSGHVICLSTMLAGLDVAPWLEAS